ncbi:MAG: phosphate/phosphite/phosphonate ABC transporter substrate-binding protein [Nitrospirota bacterium]|nr:phosphate/phosphite/phosphonate ABC transporter substrate-binding protein [Nitrospirota bacterium]
MKRILILTCLSIAVLSCLDLSATAPAEGNKDRTGDTLLIGLIPERNIFEQMERYEPLAAYLSEKTGKKIKLKILTRYGNIIDNFVSLGLDGAFFGSFTYALAHARTGIEPVARPEDPDGVSTYHGLIFVRKDSGIKTVKDMKGKVFAFVDKATTAGYLLPLVFFRENGMQDYRTFFRETYFAGTHEDTIYDVLNKKADMGAAKNTIFRNLADTDKRLGEELIIIKRSPDVPQNGLAVRKSLDSRIRARLKEALLDMHNDVQGRSVLKKFGAKRFIETKDRDYDSVYEYIRKIDLDPATYDYMND